MSNGDNKKIVDNNKVNDIIRVSSNGREQYSGIHQRILLAKEEKWEVIPSDQSFSDVILACAFQTWFFCISDIGLNGVVYGGQWISPHATVWAVMHESLRLFKTSSDALSRALRVLLSDCGSFQERSERPVTDVQWYSWSIVECHAISVNNMSGIGL